MTDMLLAIVVAGLGATVYATPLAPEHGLAGALPGEGVSTEGIAVLTQYFGLLATKAWEDKGGAAPVCDTTQATLPISWPSPLPAVSKGLMLKHVAIGRGTQNYTCADAQAAPVTAGAVATLFNATCLAAVYPDLLNLLPRVSMQFGLAPKDRRLTPTSLAVSGKHYFPASTVPFFNLDYHPDLKLGQLSCTKNASGPAPVDAPRGLNGEAAVPWLKLLAQPDATGDVHEVYRVETAGGSAPATCEGMPPTLEVPYAAQYWFFARARSHT